MCSCRNVCSWRVTFISSARPCLVRTGLLIRPWAGQERKKLQRQKILSFIYPIYNHNWRNIISICVYNKTSIKRIILTIKQNTSGSRSGKDLSALRYNTLPLQTRGFHEVKVPRFQDNGTGWW